MAELVKQWNDRESLFITYDGNEEGSAIFSSDTYNGIDREMEVHFVGGELTKTCKVVQEGTRQPIGLSGGGILRLANGGRFGVLKESQPYTEVEYIEATGTQYIDTKVIGYLNISYEIGASTNSTSTKYMVLFGSRSSANSRNITTLYNNSSVVNDFGDYSKTRQSFTLLKSNVKYKIYNSYNKRLVYDYSTNTLTTVTSNFTSSFTTPNNLYIGYKSEGFTDEMLNFSGKLYYCKIWNGNILIRDFIPVLDNNGTVCMYDRVSKEFFYNQGLGEFIAGNIK